MTSLSRRLCVCSILCAILVALPLCLWAKPVDSKVALDVASAWLSGNAHALASLPSATPVSARGIRPFRDSAGTVLAYIVDLDPRGFIVVPADDLVEPVLTYGARGDFSGTLGPNDLLSHMLVLDIPARIQRARQSATLGAQSDPYLAKVAQRWTRLIAASRGANQAAGTNGGSTIGAVTPVVSPIVQDHWDQTSGNGPQGPWTYEYYTPNHYLTGCVATAMGMIIHHHRYPASASGTNSIQVDGVTQQASFSSTYNYSLMTAQLQDTDPENVRQEVSKLLYDCGIAVGMSYSANFSGASAAGMLAGYQDFFSYPEAQWKEGDNPDWATVLKSELDAGFPIEMAILSTDLGSGHAIVCDGWGTEDGQDRFHLNMGWSGQHDNWYHVPGFATGYYYWDVLMGYVYNIRPAAAQTLTCTVTAPASPTRTTPIDFTITFSESVTDLTAAEISVTGGTKGTLTPDSGANYTLPVTPSGNGAVTCQVPAGAAQGAQSRPNEVSNTASVVFDGTAPTCEVSGPTTYTGSAPADIVIRFTESVTGLTAGEISLTGGTAGALSGSGQNYTLTVIPVVGQNVTCQVPAGAAQDAAGNASVISNTWTVTYDPGGPSVVVVSPTTSAAYTTESATIDIAGTASHANGITSVVWQNNRGGTGACTGTLSWSATGIQLQVGQNTITVTATSGGGFTGTDALYVTYEPANELRISVCPGNVGLAMGAQQRFRVFEVSATGGETPTTQTVTWAADGNAGTVTSTGTFTAGTDADTYGSGVTSSVPGATARAAGIEVFAAQAQGGHVIERWWGRTPADRIDAPRDVAVDSEGCVYIVDRTNHRVQEFDLSGSYVRHWGSEGTGVGQFKSPSGIAMDADRNIYVADTGNSRIQKFDAYGNFIQAWGSAGAGDGQFQSPEAVAVDAEGSVYVADTGNYRVQKFSSTGTFERKWGSSGTGNGQFTTPSGIAADASGNVYVSDRSSTNVRIQKFSAAGAFITKWGSYGTANGQFTSIRDVAVDALGNVYAVDSARRVQKFSSNGGYLAKWGSTGSGDGQFEDAWSASVDSGGSIYVTDVGNARVQRFDSAGNYVGKWSSGNGSLGQFRSPSAAAVDSGGDIYIVDAANCRIQKFDSNGDFITAWGSRGVESGQFKNPTAVAVDASDCVYVADTDNNRIQKFSPAGGFLWQMGVYGKNPGEFINPSGVGVDEDGSIYVSDRWGRVQVFSADRDYLRTFYNNGGGSGAAVSFAGVAVDHNNNVYVADETGDCIQKFDVTGAFRGKWGALGSGNGQFMQPKAVAVSASGDVFVADTNNHRVQKIDSGGIYRAQWGSQGSATGQFSRPSGIAVDGSGNVFVVDTGNNRVQKFRAYASALAPMITTPTTAPTYFTSSGTLTVAGTAVQDVVGLTWANSRGGSGTCVGTAVWSAAAIQLYPGQNTIAVTARDASDNTGSSQIVVTYDSVAPAVTITGPTTEPTWSTVDGFLSINGTASDDQGVASVAWSNDRGGSGTCTGTTSWSATGVAVYPGVNMITVTARDSVENTSSDTLAVTFADTSAPIVSITSPTASGQYVTSDPLLSLAGTAADNGPITSVMWSNSRGGGGTCTGTTSWSAVGVPLLVGANVITVTATDSAGLTATANLIVTLLDTVAPVVSITAPTSDPTYSTDNPSVDLGGSASDNVGVTSVTWVNDRGGSGTCTGAGSWTGNVPLPALGANVITVTAHDAAGNTATDTITVTRTGTTPPLVDITSPTTAATYSTNQTTVSLAGSASDDVGVVSVAWASSRGYSGACMGTTSWNAASIPLLSGANVITVTAIDTAGNPGSDTLTVTFTDNTVPTVAFASPTSQSSYSTTASTLSIAGTASDNVALTSVAWSNDRGGGGPCSGTASWSAAGINLALGQNVISVTALDSSGNRKTATLTVIRSDGTIPAVTITAPTVETAYSTGVPRVSIAGTASDDVGVISVVWSNDKGGSGACAGTTSWSAADIPLRTGENIITVTATDAAGNAGTDTITVTLSDTTVPTVAITGPTSATTYTTSAATIDLSGTASDNFEVAMVSWCNDRTTCGACTGTTSWTAQGLELLVGHNVFTITVRDAAGNASTDTLTVIANDGQAPSVAITSPSGDGAFSTIDNTVDLAGTADDNVAVTGVTWSSDRGGSGSCVIAEPNQPVVVEWDPTRYGHGANVLEYQILRDDFAGSSEPVMVIRDPAQMDAGQADVSGLYGRAEGTAVVYYRLDANPSTSAPTETTWTVPAEPYGIAHSYQVRVVYKLDGAGGTRYYYSPVSNAITATAFAPATAVAWAASDIQLFAGQNAITVTARDAVGNTNTSVITVTCSDATAPTVAITAPTSAETYPTTNATVSIAGTASDNTGVSSVTWSDGRGGSGTCTGTTSWSAAGIQLALGQNTITVTAADGAGNTSSDVLTVTCTDSTAPTVQILEPTIEAACSRTCDAVAISGTAADNLEAKSVTWSNSRGGGGVCTGTLIWSAVVALAPGTNVITVTAEDTAGNTAIDAITVQSYDVSSAVAAAWRGLAMVSLPVVPDVADPKAAVGFYSDRWLMFDTAANAYIGYGSDPTHRTWFEPADATPGRGFWASFDPQGTVPCGMVPRQDQAAVVSLRSGWNLIGQPFMSAVTWDMTAIKVRSGGVEKTLDDAYLAGWIKDYAWGWTPNPTTENPYGGAYYLVCDSSGAGGAAGTLEPWQAYWVRAMVDCDLVLPSPAGDGPPPPPLGN